MSKLRTLSGDEIITVGPGFVGLFAADSPPEGWLAMNGAEISLAVYSKLFSVIGTRYGVGDGENTYNLPNAEDRFPRFAAGGLVVGEKQEDAIRDIIGKFAATSYNTLAVQHASGAFRSEQPNLTMGSTSGAYVGTGITDFKASRAVPTAYENRPKAIAFLACIKY